MTPRPRFLEENETIGQGLLRLLRTHPHLDRSQIHAALPAVHPGNLDGALKQYEQEGRIVQDHGTFRATPTGRLTA